MSSHVQSRPSTSFSHRSQDKWTTLAQVSRARCYASWLASCDYGNLRVGTTSCAATWRNSRRRVCCMRGTQVDKVSQWIDINHTWTDPRRTPSATLHWSMTNSPLPFVTSSLLNWINNIIIPIANCSPSSAVKILSIFSSFSIVVVNNVL